MVLCEKGWNGRKATGGKEGRNEKASKHATMQKRRSSWDTEKERERNRQKAR